jgi:hypothetical protein
MIFSRPYRDWIELVDAYPAPRAGLRSAVPAGLSLQMGSQAGSEGRTVQKQGLFPQAVQPTQAHYDQRMFRR